jgi:hypothetical protein
MKAINEKIKLVYVSQTSISRKILHLFCLCMTMMHLNQMLNQTSQLNVFMFAVEYKRLIILNYFI